MFDGVAAPPGRCVAIARRELRRLRTGIEEGSLSPCDPKMAAFMLAGALSWVGRWYRPDGALAPQQIADQAVALLLGGVLAPAARRTFAHHLNKTPETLA